LEVLTRRYGGAPLLEAVCRRLPGTPECHKHRLGSLVCHSCRSQMVSPSAGRASNRLRDRCSRVEVSESRKRRNGALEESKSGSTLGARSSTSLPPLPQRDQGPNSLHQPERPSPLKKSISRSHQTGTRKSKSKPRIAIFQRVKD